MSVLGKTAAITPYDQLASGAPPANAFTKGAVDLAGAIEGIGALVKVSSGVAAEVKNFGKSSTPAVPATPALPASPAPPAAPSSPLAAVSQEKWLMIGAGVLGVFALLIVLKKI